MENKLEAVRNTGKIIAWKRRLEKSRKSGLSVQDWCNENGISVKTYYYWNRKIKRLNEENANEGNFYEIPGNQHYIGNVVATLRIVEFSADIYEGADLETLTAVCRAMKTC